MMGSTSGGHRPSIPSNLTLSHQCNRNCGSLVLASGSAVPTRKFRDPSSSPAVSLLYSSQRDKRRMGSQGVCVAMADLNKRTVLVIGAVGRTGHEGCNHRTSGLEPDPQQRLEQEQDPQSEVTSLGVKAALSMLKFYKREISPLLPNSCRYVPTCSEYSMIAYKKYGVVKGSILTAWRLCRCNPLGGSGFDPPRWFGEERAQEE